MISLTCTQCKAVLEMDEAFAGGVCRCQYCGTIQTVPSHLKHASSNSGQSSGLANKVAVGGRGGAKTLYQTGQSSGLDAIAEVVASSGLSGSGLTSGRMRKPVVKEAPAAAPAARNRLPLLLVAAGVVIALLVGVIIWLASQGGTTPPANAPAHSSGPTPAATGAPVASNNPKTAADGSRTPGAPAAPAIAATKSGPNYLGLDLQKEQSVIYLLDRGSATREDDRFNSLKLACFKSIGSLTPTRKFQVILWNNDPTQPDVASPAGLAYATRENAETCRADLDVVTQGSASTVNSALEKALAQNPSAVILATAKSLDDTFVKAVMDLRNGKGVRIYGVAVGGNPATTAALAKIAEQTGAQSREITDSELGEAAN